MGNSMEDKHTDVGVYEGMIKKKKKERKKTEKAYRWELEHG